MKVGERAIPMNSWDFVFSLVGDIRLSSNYDGG